jgi:ketosteroid isomerase-like protein
MTPAAELAGLLGDAYARFLAGTPGPLLELLDADAVYHLPGRHLGGGVLRGRAAILARVAEAAAAFAAPPEMALLGVAAHAPFVLTVERIAARRGRRQLMQTMCVVWRMDRGRCVELWAHPEDAAACDAFWAGWRPPSAAALRKTARSRTTPRAAGRARSARRARRR